MLFPQDLAVAIKESHTFQVARSRHLHTNSFMTVAMYQNTANRTGMAVVFNTHDADNIFDGRYYRASGF